MSTRYFGSLAELASYVKALPRGANKDTESILWAGGTHEDAQRYATQGWAEGAKLASEIATRLASRIVASPSAQSMTTTIGYDVAGAAYDPGAYNAGVPECWSTLLPTDDKKGVHIVVNILASGGVRATVVQQRGLAIAAMAMVFQSQGYPVTIDVGQCLVPSCATEREDVFVRLADASSGAPLDLDRIVYGIAHATVMRRLLRAVTDKEQNPTGSRWGTARFMGMLPEKPGDIYVDSVHLEQSERWQDGGEAWIIKEYMRQTTA